MKKSINTFVYILSLFLIAVAFYLIIEFKDNQRIELISGFIVPISFIINIFSFTTRKNNA